ncbi:MAG: DUF4832 domain-containing protein [Clostridia bacterium]|nr:DUF4832 domain-containing protein [Clostridia bacterium]
MIINNFNYKREEAQNPYTGFTSFQHFRGEKLYEDIVVLPENKFTETERVECYPVSPDAEEIDSKDGYYPDSTTAYIRILWKEFEPKQGEYNYKFIEDILEDAKAHGQVVMFRLMAHSTRACDDVPDWLKELIPCPERPYMERVKDSPTDPLFLELFKKAVLKFGERFDSHPVLESVDISLPGAWGEGHNLHLYPQEDLDSLVDTYISVFKKTQLFCQVSRPELLHYLNTMAEIPAGWRGDGFGNTMHMEDIYPPKVEKVADNWKIGPVSFESYWWIGEWERQGWDIDLIIEKSLEWHATSFNAKSINIPVKFKDKIEAWISKMGYHFVIDAFGCPESASSGETVSLKLDIDNVGVAPFYKKAALKVRLVNAEKEYVFDTDVDIKKWFPGKYENAIDIKLPEDIASGEYDVEINIGNDQYPLIYFATDAVRNENFYKVGKITIK